MADLTQLTEESRHKLPPISPRNKPLSSVDSDKKPVKKKKKKPVSESTDPDGQVDNTVTPKRRRRKLSGEHSDVDGGKDITAADVTDGSVTKRRRRKPDAGQASESEETPRVRQKRKTPRTQQNVSGSKTSLLSKDDQGETTTTKPKPKKKRKKKVTKPSDDGDYTDSGLAADLTSIEDDVVAMDDTLVAEEQTVNHPNSVVTLKSQATNKIFVETDSGFKGQNKSKVAKRLAEEKMNRPLEQEESTSSTSIEFALKTHHFLKTVFLFCHGITAGIALWHIVIVYTLSYHPTEDFLTHYQPLALPVQSMFYILIVCCTISAFDRHDIGHPTRRFLLQAVTMQSGAVSVVIYFLALVFSVAIAAEADRINLYYANLDLWTDSQVSESELNVWRSLNTVRGVFIILGWFVMSLTPNTDRLSQNLKTNDDLLGTRVEMLSVSTA